MLATRLRRSRSRRGMTAVESALVLSVFMLLLFGMFEYCRFLMVLHVANNATRDGARYAVVNVSQSSSFATTIQTYTTARMGGMEKNIENYRVAVYAVDQDGLDLTPPVVRPKTKSTATPKVYPDPFNSSDSNAVSWNSSGFTEKIAVTIDGNFRPALPTLLLMPSTISVKTTAIMGSEG